MRYPVLLGLIFIFYSAQASAGENAPSGYSFGVGIGWAIPTDVTTPNLVATSFYYKGMEFQPILIASSQSDVNSVNDGVVTSVDHASNKTFGLGAVFKYAFAHRQNMDLQFIGSINYAKVNATDDPDGPNNRATSESKSLDVSYGLGLQWWFASHFSVMATATNPLIADTTTTTTQEDVAGVTITESKQHQSGFVWDPQVAIAVMMWF